MRWFGAVVAGLTVVGCATTPLAGANAGDSRQSESGPLSDARRRRDSAALIVPPALPAGASPTAVVSFMKESVAAWVQSRRAAVDACTDAYRDAGKDLAPPERAGAMLEASKAALAFLDDYAKVSNDVASALATDPEMKAELLVAFRESERPHVDMTKGLLDECISSDDRGSGSSGAAAECRMLLRNLPGAARAK